MANINNYDTYLIRFKKEMWDSCLKNNLFSNIPEQNLENVKKTFEFVLSNYQNQILQNQNSKVNTNINNVIINEINKQIQKFKVMTKLTRIIQKF